VVSDFVKLPAEANYILYAGHMVKPPNLDAWTEYTSNLWSAATGTFAAVQPTKSDDATKHTMNSHSIKLTTGDGAGGDVSIFYPAAGNAGWEIGKWGANGAFQPSTSTCDATPA